MNGGRVGGLEGLRGVGRNAAPTAGDVIVSAAPTAAEDPPAAVVATTGEAVAVLEVRRTAGALVGELAGSNVKKPKRLSSRRLRCVSNGLKKRGRTLTVPRVGAGGCCKSAASDGA